MKAAILFVVAVFALLAVHAHARHRLDAFLSARAGATLKARDVRSDCYKVSISSVDKVCKGDDLLTAVRKIGAAALTGAAKLSTKKADSFPGSLKRCNYGQTATKYVAAAVAPADETKDVAYYGEVKTPADFRVHAASKCGGVASANGDASDVKFRYFKMGKYLYFRQCTSLEGNGFVILWGTTDNTDIPCAKHQYPEMWLKTKAKDSGTATVDAFKALATAGTNTNPYMGMMGAAVLMAEAARDYTVVVLNYMLMDLTKDAELILGGKCPATAGTCKNTGSTKDGLHPMAFGGAQASFTKGSWPQGQAASAWSTAGLDFEGKLVVDWFTTKGLATKATNCDNADSASTCETHVTDVVKTVAHIS